ncbi:MAG: hypothetical protein [Bacteriophage sp.]|nr:MAG: hypothetical protein [Bacteriophage sp.]
MENTKNTKEARERADLINKINNRAYELGIMYGSRLNHSMDIDYAVQAFDIDLEAWLNSADTDFIHDYVGIYRNIDRDAISLKHAAAKNDFGIFVPRFAKENAGNKFNNVNMILWNKLKEHRGHKVNIVSYGDWDDPLDICLECEDCGEVILDAEIYTLHAREDEENR